MLGDLALTAMSSGGDPSHRAALLSQQEAPPRQHDMRATAPSGVHARQALDHDELMAMQEQSPAYRALHENNLINSQYRVRRVDELDLVRGNATMSTSTLLKLFTCNGCCCLINFFVTSNGHIQRGMHSDGRYIFYGEGVHVIPSPFVSRQGPSIGLTEGVIINGVPDQKAIIHGTRGIVTVEQGFVGLAMDRGQPLLLPPGMHQWDNPSIEFLKLIDLSTSVITLGPYTLVTVDEGYAAVTQDNGQQKILDGGRSYMLTHRNWKFEKFITKKLQTNDVGPLTVTTGDNVPLETTATVNWLIEDVKLACLMAANTMVTQGGPPQNRLANSNISEFDITKLRQDVLRQVTASLAAFVGTISYSAHGHAAMSARIAGEKREALGPGEPEPEEKGGSKALFDREQLNSSVIHANEICGRYGVRILSINLISAYPADRGLLEALSKGAVSTVAAEQCETIARGEARAMVLKAKAEGEAEKIRAEGDARAEEIRAQGSLNAANLVEKSEVAVTLAKMKAAGVTLADGKANSFFFGLGGPADISSGILGTALMSEAAASRR